MELRQFRRKYANIQNQALSETHHLVQQALEEGKKVYFVCQDRGDIAMVQVFKTTYPENAHQIFILAGREKTPRGGLRIQWESLFPRVN